MAEWTCGTADWLPSAGKPCPCRCIWGAAPAPHAPFLSGILQWREDTPLAEQRCAGTAGCSGRWAHSREPNSRRITPSVCSDLIYDRDTWRVPAEVTDLQPCQARPHLPHREEGAEELRCRYQGRRRRASAPRRSLEFP